MTIRAFAAFERASLTGRRAVSACVAALIGAAVVIAPPAMAAPSAKTPARSGLAVGASVAAASNDAPGGRRGSLPRQFSIEVGPGGVLVADGTRLGAASELERWAQRALAAARFSGAVVFGNEASDAALIGDVVARLHRAGFTEVRRAGRAAPAEVSALARSGAPPLITERVMAERAAAAPRAAPAPRAAAAPRAAPALAVPAAAARAPAVSLATAGLHVDGPLNREPHRGRLVRAFEREFSAFRRCHERAERHDEGASFGVDLLIPKAGGRGKVRQTRTRLASKAFRSCMLGALESIRFAPPPSERPEVVSYSVLFKPSARR